MHIILIGEKIFNLDHLIMALKAGSIPASAYSPEDLIVFMRKGQPVSLNADETRLFRSHVREYAHTPPAAEGGPGGQQVKITQTIGPTGPAAEPSPGGRGQGKRRRG